MIGRKKKQVKNSSLVQNGFPINFSLLRASTMQWSESQTWAGEKWSQSVPAGNSDLMQAVILVSYEPSNQNRLIAT